MMKIFYGLLLTCFVSQAGTQHIETNPSMDELFDHSKVTGTMVVYDSETSTFKIANSLIGLLYR